MTLTFKEFQQNISRKYTRNQIHEEIEPQSKLINSVAIFRSVSAAVWFTIFTFTSQTLSRFIVYIGLIQANFRSFSEL